MGYFLLKDNSQILLLGNKFVKEMYFDQNSIIQTADTIYESDLPKYLNLGGNAYIQDREIICPNKDDSVVFNRAFLDIWMHCSLNGDISSNNAIIYKILIYKASNTTTPYVTINVYGKQTGVFDYVVYMEGVYKSTTKQTTSLSSWTDGSGFDFNITYENKELTITLLKYDVPTSMALSLSFDVDEYIPLYAKVIKTTTYSSMHVILKDESPIDSKQKITYYPQYKTNLT